MSSRGRRSSRRYRTRWHSHADTVGTTLIRKRSFPLGRSFPSKPKTRLAYPTWCRQVRGIATGRLVGVAADGRARLFPSSDVKTHRTNHPICTLKRDIAARIKKGAFTSNIYRLLSPRRQRSGVKVWARPHTSCAKQFADSSYERSCRLPTARSTTWSSEGNSPSASISPRAASSGTWQRSKPGSMLDAVLHGPILLNVLPAPT